MSEYVHFVFSSKKQIICVRFYHLNRFSHFSVRFFMYSVVLEKDMILTSSFHQFEALNVAYNWYNKHLIQKLRNVKILSHDVKI